MLASLWNWKLGTVGSDLLTNSRVELVVGEYFLQFVFPLSQESSSDLSSTPSDLPSVRECAEAQGKDFGLIATTKGELSKKSRCCAALSLWPSPEGSTPGTSVL